MQKKTILTVIPVNGKHQELLEKAAQNEKLIFSDPESVTQEQVDQAEIILGNVPPEMVKKAKKLEWLQLNSAGFDAYAKKEIMGDRILTSCSGAYGQAVSEHMFAMLLAMQKKLHLYRDDQKAHKWGDEGQVTSISDTTVIVLGLGDIGKHFAWLAHALGAYVIGIKRTYSPCPEYVDELHLQEDTKGLLPKADAVVSFLPSSEENKGFFGKEFFDQMKPGSLFLNGGRGDTVSTEDLYQALKEGKLGGAALDVTDPEPLPKDHPLWDMPQVFLTPHVSGGYHLSVTLDNVVDICVGNLRRYLAGESLKNLVQVRDE